MPITLTQGGAINNYYGAPNQAKKTSAQSVIAQLQYTDIWRGAGTLRDDRVMRVDMQGAIPARGNVPAQQNLQVQVDGVNGNSTVAHAIVSVSIQTNDPGNQAGALRKVISALNQSLDSGRSYTVTGTSP